MRKYRCPVRLRPGPDFEISNFVSIILPKLLLVVLVLEDELESRFVKRDRSIAIVPGFIGFGQPLKAIMNVPGNPESAFA